MAVDAKYGTVLVQHGDIPSDEPVVVFRAKDKTLPTVLTVYRAVCELIGSPEHHLQAVDRALTLVKQWQRYHATKVPSSDRYKESEE